MEGRRKRAVATVVVAALTITMAVLPAAGANNPDTESRNAGYYSASVQEYPELAVLYEDAEPEESVGTFEEKRERCRKKEAEWVEHDSDSCFVSCREFNTGGCRVFLTHILVKDPGLQVRAGLSNDEFGGERERTSDFAKRTGAAVAVNGSYFYYNTGKPIDVCAPAVLNDGKILRDGNSNGSEMCLRSDGSFFSPHPSLPFSADSLLKMGVTSVFGTADPLLIADGTPQSFPEGVSGASYPRTAVGVVWPGEYYLLTAGSDASYSGGLTYMQMQSVFSHLGCTYARSLDGGGSVSLVVNGELKNVPAEGSERAVVDFLAFYDEEDARTVANGGGKATGESSEASEGKGTVQERIAVLSAKEKP